MILLRDILFESVNKRGIEVRPIRTQEEADKFNEFLSMHYLGKGTSGINIKLGVFYNGVMVGMLGFGSPTFVGISKELGVNSGEVVELRRMFLLDEFSKSIHNAASQVIPMGISEMKLIRPQTKVVISYADPSQGHEGTAYQATNAFYMGKGSGKTGKHKYLYFVGSKGDNKRIQQFLAGRKQEYPKGE